MSRLLIALIVLVHVCLIAAFSPAVGTKWVATQTRLPAMMAAKLDILAREIELTEPLKDRVDSKIGHVLTKFEGLPINKCNVVLRVHKHQAAETHTHTTKVNSQIAEVTISMKGGHVVHITERSDDMYSSVDMVSHKVAQKLRRLKERVKDKRHSRSGIESSIEDIEIEEISSEELDLSKYDDDSALPESMMLESALKPKEFHMPPISVEEAVENLSYIDHPFYVFRNKETDEVNVIYKRNSGGVGLIMPEKAKSLK